MNLLKVYISAAFVLTALLLSCSSHDRRTVKVANPLVHNTWCLDYIFRDSSSIDSLYIIFMPSVLDGYSRVDCEYAHDIRLSKDTSIYNLEYLDTINLYLSDLVPVTNQTVLVDSYIACTMFYHNGTTSELHLGLFRGTCLDGVKMNDNMYLQRYIKEKIGYYGYFDEGTIEYFRELNTE